MVTFANLTSGSARNESTTYNTASVAPAADRLVLLAISTFETTATQPTPPSVSGNGLDWVLVGSFDHDAAGGDRSTCFVFRAMGAAPVPGQVTFIFPDIVSRCGWNVDEADGVNTGGTFGSAAVVQFVTNTGTNLTTITGTLAAFSNPANAAYGAFGVQAASGTSFVPGVGFTTLGVANGQSFALCYTESDGNDPTVDGSWVASGRAGVLAIEVAAGGAAPPQNSTGLAVADTLATSDTTTVRTTASGAASGATATADQTSTRTTAQAATADTAATADQTSTRVTAQAAEAAGTATADQSSTRTTAGPAQAAGAATGDQASIRASSAQAVARAAATAESAPAAGAGVSTGKAVATASATATTTTVRTKLADATAVATAGAATSTARVGAAVAVAQVDATGQTTTRRVTTAVALAHATASAVAAQVGSFTPALDPGATTSGGTGAATTLASTATATTNGVDMKTGDLEPAWVITISDTAGLADLNGVVSWRLLGMRGSTLVVDDLTPDVVVDPAEAWKATVTHQWETGETDHTAGFRLVGAVVAMWPGDRPQTFPGKSVVTVDFEKQLA